MNTPRPFRQVTNASTEMRRAPQRRALVVVGWVGVALPAFYQLSLLVAAIAGRIGYGYDLEWMEGGLLHHAQRLSGGHGLYAPPSVEFIPYLYTPLYPALLALLGKIFGLSYTLGRVISVLSLAGIAAIAAVSIAAPRFRHFYRTAAWAGVALALGLFAAVYPYVEGWYDLVRADTLFCLLVTAGLAAAAVWSRDGEGWRGHARVAAVATILVLAFYTKQTGIFYVALGGVVVLVLAWRRIVTYVAVCALLGVGGVALGNAATDGWLWIYIQRIHQAHDFNHDRFWASFGKILWHFPAMTIVIVFALGVVMYTWLRPLPMGARRELPRQARPFLLWTSAFAVSVVVGAVGWGTEFARSNAYIPAFLHGALAAGAAVPALASCSGILWGSRPRAGMVAHATSGAAAFALALTLVAAPWSPAQFVPQSADRAAAARLVARVRAIDGEVWIPSHPWYLALAGKTPWVHRMGITDVTRRQSRSVVGLEDKLRKHEFAALVLDSRDVAIDLPIIGQTYRPALKLPADERPRLFTGAGSSYDPWGCCLVPDTIWLPAVPAQPPPGAHAVFDFEQAAWTGWQRSGPAWGDGPVAEALPGQDLVVGATGMRFATSMHGGDVALGRITSPEFLIDGVKITVALGGSTDATKLRAELWVGGALVRTAGVPAPGGDTLRQVRWDVAEFKGKQGKLVFVDDSPVGHLDCDDVWIWEEP